MPASSPSCEQPQPADAVRMRRSLPIVGSGSPGARPLSSTPRRASLDSGPPPRSVRISVTDRCDFACTYCRPSHSEGYNDGKLALRDWLTVFEGLRLAGVRRVRLTGGEPLVHPDILGIVRHLAAMGFEDVAM